jgi:hypothetical protein
VRELMRRSPRFFFWTALAGLALRLLFVFIDPQVTDDSLIYADIAHNWLRHGVYGITQAGNIVPTYIRLPGYPAFLAALFAIFGQDNFRAVLLVQVLVDLGTCFLIADLIRRTVLSSDARRNTDTAAKAGFLLAAVCPFFANYAGAVLTETLEIFFTVAALDLLVIGLSRLGYFRDQASRRKSGQAESRSAAPHLAAWIGCGLAIASAILLRPDGGLLLISVGLYLLFVLLKFGLSTTSGSSPRETRTIVLQIFSGAVVVGLVALVPLVPWTVRNLRTMHRFQPLTPRYANNPGDYVPVGFNRWVKTWIADYVSVQEIYWQVPGEEIDPSKLPSRAYDSAAQKDDTLKVLDRYNQAKDIGESLDAQFAALARQRIQAAPLRYYVWLPMVRIADMWLRPRTELSQADPRWWEFNDDLKWSVLSVGFGVINLLYVMIAGAGLLRERSIHCFGLLLCFVIVRSAFLGTLENPETRYTLECYPVVILLTAATLGRTRPTFSTLYGKQ